jgi:hypothetical protein
VGAHRTALTRARGITFVDCIPSNPGTYRKRSLEGGRFPSVSDAFTRAPILGGNSPARRTPKGTACAAAMHRRVVRTGCPAEVAVASSAVRSHLALDLGRVCDGNPVTDGAAEAAAPVRIGCLLRGVGSWIVNTSRPRHEHRLWTRWARFGLRSSLMTPCCPRHGQLSIRRHRDHVGITTPAFRTTSPLCPAVNLELAGDPARDGAR